MKKNVIGHFVKYQRVRLGLTQNELSKRVNLRRQAIIELERNKCNTSFDIVEDILNSLGYELIPVKKGQNP